MKKLSIKMVVVLACVMMGFVVTMKGQVSSKEPCIYSNHNGRYYIISFSGNYARVATGRLRHGFYEYEIKEGFEKSSTWTDDITKDWSFVYDSQTSTSARKVYVTVVSGTKYYLAVSNDLSTIKYWCLDNKFGLWGTWSSSGVAGEPAEGVRMDPEQFKPKANSKTNKYDFLND